MLPKSFGQKSKPEKINEPNDWDALRAFMPTSFGKQQQKRDLTEDYNKTKRETTKEQPKTPEKKPEIMTDQSVDESDDDMDSEDESSFHVIPTSHEIKLNDHNRTVSSLTLDPSGTRLITGSYDYDLKFWDFAGMDRSFKPFRTIQPCGEHQIHKVQYSLSGDSVLVISGSARAKIFDRDGTEICEYAKGDPYIRDLKHTDGHVGALTSGSWHPSDKQVFATGSQDGTIREWDIERKRKQKTTLVYKSRERGGRSSCTALAYSHDAKHLAGAYQDGTLQIWGTTGSQMRPAISIPDAHQKGTETSGIVFSKDNHTMVTRGGDESVKLWDLRNAKKPVKTAYNLDIVNPEVNVIFSPDEKLILTGTACPKGQGHGQLVMLNRDTLEVHESINVTQSSVVSVLWHPRINQIMTGSADGIVTVFYSPTHSQRGAKLCVTKAPKKRAVDDYQSTGPILTPHALPMFKEGEQRISKRKREKMRLDPVKSHRPDLPVNGHGRGGRVGMNQQQAVIKSFAKDTTRDEDPREALLKYAEVAENDPQWVGNVYKKTQPKPVFEDEQEEEET
ncbi:WD40-repeat-containing domain protein [Gilbertella persicaria]|uniref:WD40-repeat-containing domain protein n=1 Tax=Gilbertella persicaria TaxID=101096 RepID=UPI00221F9EAB|nr:WD40-repeat-containing domain protein [Gilbertella persicaria]KAI8098356.1 WD40-repeat-containing domain protein [Gilbertella persicaria]